jgi:hypothetical protein
MMKKILFVLVLSVCVSGFTGCNKEDENVTDPIVGTWVNNSSGTINGVEFKSLWKWTFSEDKTGNYSFTSNGTIEEESTFIWENKDSLYNIDYASADIEDVKVIISSFLGTTDIETTDGTILGIKAE